MRKLLIMIIIFLLAVATYFFFVDGVALGDYEVLGYYGIKQLSDNLDTKVDQATRLTTLDFKNSMNDLNQSLEDLAAERKRYEEKVAVSSNEDIDKASQTENYLIEFLWVRIGNYATENRVVLKLDVTNSSSGGAEQKDLNFTVNGSYNGITDFIYDLEDDQKLQFKIEDFKLVPVTAGTEKNEGGSQTASALQATFSVKELDIKLD